MLKREDCLASMRTILEFGLRFNKDGKFFDIPMIEYIKFVHNRLEAKDCPKCGNQVEADFVDNGVGLQQSGPYVCQPDHGGCGWIQPGIDDLFPRP